ncbi:hypothetical protein Kpol_1002p99 [Vanderwaltozyma polyspora DSM 70294]|uniref:OPT superfamily oligopeptide transporter n=1 Tax=Vanderwaltozyma polyspora (strain ATCC 22028 / DSM 70294 / BCRC 21397 / CBS 2163 / NBRC 10782 / NRRL Y-8283 / UCD 57-17) TaxID=436907 RepID=A7TEC9_VANPO|nr:uncharacterized protein Kpol_1002p99 [Vanderwaltozyma polyspora DSM 70294]EDO19451.1 hypothetical protein Kpol_1002p99 [Vanderwaltozyma polyspora DSM 70294]
MSNSIRQTSIRQTSIRQPSVSTQQRLEFHEKPSIKQVTLRATVSGLLIGSLILVSNFQFGLQTGWVSMMSLPAALLACAFFKQVWPLIYPGDTPFTDVETVYVQSMAVAVGTGPLAYGFIGVIPAIEKFLTAEETGGTRKQGEAFHLNQLLLWALALAFFGIFFAVPLRKQVIIKEKLPFPSGSATAILIAVLTGSEIMQEITCKELIKLRNSRLDECPEVFQPATEEETLQLLSSYHSNNYNAVGEDEDEIQTEKSQLYSKNISILLKTFFVSAGYTITSYFIPAIKRINIFGSYLSKTYEWNFQPSPAYVGQGIIMGLSTVSYMLFGCILGWGVLAPLAHYKGWVSRDTDFHDWENGVYGWLIWSSLAIMVADSVVGFITLTVRSLVRFMLVDDRVSLINEAWEDSCQSMLLEEEDMINRKNSVCGGLHNTVKLMSAETDNEVSPKHLVAYTTVISGLIISSIICVVIIIYIFGVDIIPIYAMVSALLLALLLSILGIRALGETDLNPVSGIGKISQLLFALIVPKNHPGSVLLNVVAGGVAEAGAQQAGDLMQDLKTGHLLGASPKAQFTAQLIGATWSIILSSVMYMCYNKVYSLPNKQFRIPTAVVWVDCARLVTGKGLPTKATECCIVFGIIFSLLSLIKNCYRDRDFKWMKWIPSGIAVGVGIYNPPSFTIARFLGGVISHYWLKGHKGDFNSKTTMIVFSSGLVLGEGTCSILNMLFTQFKVPHF